MIFNIQVPNAPFGLAWYNGDILTDSNGVGVTNIVGRFNSGTFVFSSAALPSPNTFNLALPECLPNSKTGAVTNGPVQIYPLGIWFNTPEDATAAGCKGVVPTPFTSNHRAGPQSSTRVLSLITQGAIITTPIEKKNNVFRLNQLSSGWARDHRVAAAETTPICPAAALFLREKNATLGAHQELGFSSIN